MMEKQLAANVLTRYRDSKIDLDSEYTLVDSDSAFGFFYDMVSHNVIDTHIDSDDYVISLYFSMREHYQKIKDDYRGGLITHEQYLDQFVYNALDDVYDYDSILYVDVNGTLYHVGDLT